jgi:hypothetical protein
VVVAVNGDIFVSDISNHVIHVITPQDAVRTLCGNRQAGFSDAQGPEARFNDSCGLALDTEENLLVADCGNHVIRRVTMTGAVSTVAINGEEGFTDGAGVVDRFNRPKALVVDGEGVIVVSDSDNHRLLKIVVGQVITLTDSSEPGTTDGVVVVARFNECDRLALDQSGRLLVAEWASLVPPLWMGPVEEAAEDWKTAISTKTQVELVVLEDNEKLVEDGSLEDVVLVVEGERFPTHRGVLATRSQYFYGLFLFGGWGKGDRASDRGGVPGGAVVPVHVS